MKSVYTVVPLLSLLVAACAPSGAAVRDTAPSAQPAPDATAAPLDYAALSSLLEGEGSGVLLLDVRTETEYAQGRIPGAVLLPYDALEAGFREPDLDRRIVVYCRSGNRSAIAKRTLEGMGYRNVADFGGLGNWKGPLEP